MKKPAKTAPNLLLKRARELRGWSQEDVAREVETDAFTISRWERGITLPSPHFRQKLCALFGVSAIELGLVSSEPEELSSQASRQPGEEAILAPRIETPVRDPAIPAQFAREHELVGRDGLLRHLKQRLLAEGGVTLAALNGLPGVGKTALATALAHDAEAQAHFVDGVLWAGLGYHPDVLGLLSRWGTLLRCALPELAQRSHTEAWAASIHAAIGERRMLLVIDDAWELAEALAFRVGGPNCAHLVTTRFPELARRFAVEGALVVRELEETDGRLLLMRLAPEAVQAEPEAAQALVAAVGGLPLALTLLGNFLRAQSHSGQPRRLRAALERVRSISERLQLNEPQALIGGHPSLEAGTSLSLQAVIGISDQQMSEAARTALRALAVFPPKPNSFSEEAALAVSAAPMEALDELMDAGLLESSGPERYLLHQTIADYARANLHDTIALERLAAYFIAFVEAHTAEYPALERESSNILAALEAAFERSLQPALVRGAHALAPFLITRGLYTLAETHLQRSLVAAQALEDASDQAIAWLHLGKIAEQRGDYGQAQAAWQHGLSLARQSGQQRSAARLLRELGDLAWEQGELGQAHQCIAESLEILRQQGDQRGTTDALKSLGNLADRQGEPARARAYYEEAFAAFRHLGDQGAAAVTLQNLGVLAHEQGQNEQAQARYEEAVAVFRQLGDRGRTAAVLCNLGNLARYQGLFEQAQQFLEEALALQRQVGQRRILVYTLLNLGNLAIDQGHFKQAHQHLEEALTLLRDLQARRESALALQALGSLARHERQFKQAHQQLDEALAIYQALHDPRQKALTLRDLGMLVWDQGHVGSACQHLEESLALFHQIGDRYEVAVTRKELGALARQQGQVREAQRLLTEALDTLRPLRVRHQVAQILKELGICLQQQGQLEQAAHYLLIAGVGLAIVNTPDASNMVELLGRLRAQLGEDAFLATARRAASEAPEPAYELAQTAWATAVQKLAMQTAEGERV